MKCKSISKKLIFLAEKSLPVAEEIIIFQHLKDCVTCKEQYDKLIAVEQLIHEKKLLDVSPYFYSKLKTRLESAETNEIPAIQPAFIRVAHGSFMVLIIAIAITMGIILGQNDYRFFNNNKQVLKQTDKMIQNDYSIADEQFATNYFNF